MGKVYNLYRVKTNRSAVLTVKGGLDPDTIIKLKVGCKSWILWVFGLRCFLSLSGLVWTYCWGIQENPSPLKRRVLWNSWNEFSGISNLWNLESWTCEAPKSRICGDLKPGACEAQESWTCEDLKSWAREAQESWTCEDPECRTCEAPKLRTCKDPESRTCEAPKLRTCKDLKSWTCEAPEVMNLQNHEIRSLRNSGVCQSSSTEVAAYEDFLNGEIHKSVRGQVKDVISKSPGLVCELVAGLFTLGIFFKLEGVFRM
jgi:hypothetical protein